MKDWKYKNIDVDLIVYTEVNANKMTDKEFKRLVQNIRISGLSSVITCYQRADDGKFVIISGNHRYKACLSLRYKTVPVLYVEEKELSNDEIIALQLSHNSLHGSCDDGILKRLFNEIQSIDFKEFANIDIDQIDKIDVDSVSFSLESESYSLTCVLYRKDIDNLKELVGITNEAKEKSDYVIIADGNNTESFMLSLMNEIKKKYQIKSSNVTFAKILELAKAKMYEDRNIKGE